MRSAVAASGVSSRCLKPVKRSSDFLYTSVHSKRLLFNDSEPIGADQIARARRGLRLSAGILIPSVVPMHACGEFDLI